MLTHNQIDKIEMRLGFLPLLVIEFDALLHCICIQLAMTTLGRKNIFVFKLRWRQRDV